MTEEVINPLRRRMIEDMTIRNFDQRTQHSYLRAVRSCCRYCDRRPSELTFEDVRLYQLHLTQGGLAPSSINGAMVSLRFFFRVTLRRPEALDYIPIVREPQRLPVVLTQSEVASLIEAATSLKWRTALSVAYGAGLRASEVVGLKIGDIDSRRMRIRVEQGKGRRDRDAMLSPHLLRTLRDWWRVAKPPVWLFPNRLTAFEHVTPKSLNRACVPASPARQSRAGAAPAGHRAFCRGWSGRDRKPARRSQGRAGRRRPTVWRQSLCSSPRCRGRSGSPVRDEADLPGSSGREARPRARGLRPRA
jgi:integrase/recombinase XerD